MNLACSTVSNAIRYSISQNGFANILIAGPICAGKSDIANKMYNFYNLLASQKIVSILNQNNFYKEYLEMEDTLYGKNIDSLTAFRTSEYVASAKKLIEDGFTYSPIYDDKEWTRYAKKEDGEIEAKEIYTLERNCKVNIFVGLHTIKLLKPVIPKSISIYVNTDFSICFRRRVVNQIMLPENIYNNFKNYEEFIMEQNKKEIMSQMNMADIIVKYNILS